MPSINPSSAVGSASADWTQGLRLRNLKILLSLAETQNMTHSAALLNTTQPGLSKWLKELEEDIGLPLFERHARGLRPTPYGKALLDHAYRIDKQLQRARGDMAALRKGQSGRIIIGASGAAASHTVPVAVLQLLEHMPQLHIQLAESTIDRLLSQLAHGDVDVVVGRYAPELHSPAIRREILYEEPIHLVARPGHPLFGLQDPGWVDVMRYRWLLWPKGTPIRNALEEALDAAGQPLPAMSVESNSVTVNLALINDSNMIGIASHRAAQRLSHINAVRILPVPLSGFGSVAMYWRHEEFLPKAVDAALACLRDTRHHSPDAV